MASTPCPGASRTPSRWGWARSRRARRSSHGSGLAKSASRGCSCGAPAVYHWETPVSRLGNPLSRSGMRFAIFIYEGVEPIDLATFGVLSMARRVAPEIEAFTVARAAGPVTLANGLVVLAQHGLADCPPDR